MHESHIDSTQPKSVLYRQLVDELRGLIAGEPDWIANLANSAALIYHSLPDLNWAGFYLLKDGELVVGPFQGKPACVRIAMGRGVCGTAAAQAQDAASCATTCTSFPGQVIGVSNRRRPNCGKIACRWPELEFEGPRRSKWDRRARSVDWGRLRQRPPWRASTRTVLIGSREDLHLGGMKLASLVGEEAREFPRRRRRLF